MKQTRTVIRTISVPSDVSILLDELATKLERPTSWICVKAIREYWINQGYSASPNQELLFTKKLLGEQV